MFLSKKNEGSLFARIKKFIIPPDKGWLRGIKYLFIRIARMKADNFSLTVGLATGVATSFTPFFGFHFILAATIAALLRSNIFAAMAGTIVGNPITFPFIFFLTHRTGSFILDKRTVEIDAISENIDAISENIKFTSRIWSEIIDVIANPLSSSFVVKIFLPMLVGSLPWALLAWGVSFAIFYPLIKYAREAVKKRKELKKK